MSVTTQYTTFADLYTAVLNATRSQTTQAGTLSQAKRAVNVALQDMHLGTDYQFYWAEREAVLTTRSPYTTGTVTATQGSAALTGSSTAWNTSDWYGNVVSADGKMLISGDTTVYSITSVSGATGTDMTLSSIYVGTTGSGLSYTFFQDTYSLASDYKRPVDLKFFDDDRLIVLMDRRKLRRHFTRNSTTGRPRYATQIELGPSGSTALRPRIVLYPPPDAGYQIRYSYITNQLAVANDGTLGTAMSADTDEPVVPLQYRSAIYYYALKMFYEHKDDQRLKQAEADYAAVMKRTLDDVNVGDNRVRIEPQVGSYERYAQEPYTEGARRSPRFDTDSNAFDQMR